MIMDDVFKKEFEKMLEDRKCYLGMYYRFNLYDIPLPSFPNLIKDVLINTDNNKEELDVKQRTYIVKGLDEPYFKKLNDTEVKIVNKDKVMKRIADADGKFIVKNDDYVYKTIDVPKGFKAIHSNIPIGIQRKIVVKGVEKLYNPTYGFHYVDYFESPTERRYVYIIPEENLVPADMGMLIMTVESSTHRDYYKGYKVALTNGYSIKLFVESWNKRNNSANTVPIDKIGRKLVNNTYRIIGAKVSMDFEQEIEQLFAFWTARSIMFDRKLTSLQYAIEIKKVLNNNIGVIELETKINEFGPESTNSLLGTE